MYPLLFNSDWLSSYALMASVGIVMAMLLFCIISTKTGLSNSDILFYGFVIVISIMFAAVSARLFQMLYNYAETGEAGTGVTFLGGLIGGVAVFFILTAIFGKKHRKELFKTVNIAMPCLTLGHFFGRIGCFLAGCCYGMETDGILGVRFVEEITKDGTYIYGPPRIPTQLIEALMLLLLTVSLILIIFRLGRLEYATVIYLYTYGFFRFLIEFIRDDSRGAFLLGLSPSQVISLIMIVGGLVLNILIIKKKVPRISTI